MALEDNNNLSIGLKDIHKATITAGFETEIIQKAESDPEYQGLVFMHKKGILFLLGNEDAEWGAGKYQVPGGEVYRGEDENRRMVENTYEDIHLDVSHGLMRMQKVGDVQYYMYYCPDASDPIVAINDSTHKNYAFFSIVALQAMSEDNFVDGLKSCLLYTSPSPRD